jgi:hypothetical protein
VWHDRAISHYEKKSTAHRRRQKRVTKMKDIELSKSVGLPVSTIQDWKKRKKEDWRHKIYRILSTREKEELEKVLQELELRGDDANNKN